MQDIDTINTINAEEEQIAKEGAYNDGGMIGALKRDLEELRSDPFAGMLNQEIF